MLLFASATIPTSFALFCKHLLKLLLLCFSGSLQLRGQTSPSTTTKSSRRAMHSLATFLVLMHGLCILEASATARTHCHGLRFMCLLGGLISLLQGRILPNLWLLRQGPSFMRGLLCLCL